MTKKEPKSSVPEEQFGDTENTEKQKKKGVKSTDAKLKKATGTTTKKTPGKKTALSEDTKSSKKKSVKTTKTSKADEAFVEISEPATPETVINTAISKTEDAEQELIDITPKTAEDNPVQKLSEHPEILHDDSHDILPKEGFVKHHETKAEATPPKYTPEVIDYSQLSREDLVKVLRDLVSTGMVNEIRKDVDAIKSSFYKKLKNEVDEIRRKFLADGGLIQDFKIVESPLEIELKELLNRYRELRNDVSKKLEDEKIINLEEKYKIIESIKELVNSQESLNKTFQEFRDLQNRW